MISLLEMASCSLGLYSLLCVFIWMFTEYIFCVHQLQVFQIYLFSPSPESMSQPDSPTDASTSTLTGAGPALQGFSDWKLPFDSERVSRTRRPSKILDVITSPPRPGSGPRRSLPPRMSSLEEHRQVRVSQQA